MNSSKARPSSAHRTTAKILAVDDHRRNLIALEAILEPLDVEVVSVTSGEDALMEVLRSDFALILMDVQMPNLDGFATTALIKERQKSKDIPVIFLSAISREQEHIFQGYSYGGVDYLVKPFDPAVLHAKVAVFIELWTHKKIAQRLERELAKREEEHLTAASDPRLQEITRFQLADALPDILWMVDATGRVPFANRAAKELLGGEGRPTDVSTLDMFHPEDAPRVQEQWRDAITSGKPFEWEARLRSRAPGAGGPGTETYRWHLGRVKPERTEGGGVAGWIATVTDIEERRRASQVVSSSARLVHELRSAVTDIVASARTVLHGRGSSAEQKAEVQAILHAAEVQSQLLDELADAAGIGR